MKKITTDSSYFVFLLVAFIVIHSEVLVSKLEKQPLVNGEVKHDMIFMHVGLDKIKDGSGEACQYRSPSSCAQIKFGARI